MTEKHPSRFLAALGVVCAAASLAGCSTLPFASSSADERACLMRAMYFESDRSSEDGLRAVGTVVMNRVASPQFPKTICGVVGQPGQFAAGVLSKPMRPDEEELVARIADQTLAGKREAAVGDAMFFHRAGLTFPYKNMHYVLVAGGNAFYEKRQTPGFGRAIDVAARVDPTPATIDNIILLAYANPPTAEHRGLSK